MDYLAWNDAIGSRFFNPDKSGSRVFLYVTKEVIDEIGAPYNSDREDFVRAVKDGPPWITRRRQGICQQALQACEGWRQKGFTYPPYLCHLALFVFAATNEAPGFARHSYYPGLRLLLGEDPHAGMYPSFEKMYELWFDLEVWSNEDKGGEWGVFVANIVGGRQYIGLPKAQTVLTDDERRKLPVLFSESGLDPRSLPSDTELVSLLAHDQHHSLLPRTKELLRSNRDEDQALLEVLLETLLDELQNWDGSLPPQEEMGETSHSSLGNLRLAMTIDTTAGRASMSLRCQSVREYPEEGLRLAGSDVPDALYCYEDWQGWSTPLFTDEARISVFDAATLNWEDGVALNDTEHSWRANLIKRPIRILISGRSFGFDGVLETNQLPRKKSFHLLAQESTANLVEEWGNTECIGFRRISNLSGIRSGWRLYSIDNAISDDRISERYPYLSFPKSLRIQFLSGLRVRGNHYFSFALPQIEISGGSDDIRVFCNGYRLTSDTGTGLYGIPRTLVGSKYIIEAKRDDELIRRRLIYAIDAIDWRQIRSRVHFNKYGKSVSDERVDSCAGPLVERYSPPRFVMDVFLPPSTERRVFFVGRNPGEVVECPKETLTQTWRPTWAIPMRRTGTAIYCALNFEEAAPTNNPVGDRRRVKLWKEILWFRRKRIAPPEHPRLRELLKQYMAVARDVC